MRYQGDADAVRPRYIDARFRQYLDKREVYGVVSQPPPTEPVAPPGTDRVAGQYTVVDKIRQKASGVPYGALPVHGVAQTEVEWMVVAASQHTNVDKACLRLFKRVGQWLIRRRQLVLSSTRLQQ